MPTGEEKPLQTSSVLSDQTIEEALKDGPRGAFFVAGVATALLFAGWLAFYFLLFLPRGSIG
jgi:hypothetical protein